ncbi:MAG: hypothetical protein NC307_04380 [Roseburia sp.]|nr:hypothetical protein [Roseburia sp.]
MVKVNMIAALVLVRFAFGAQPLAGYNYRAKNFGRLKKILRFCYGFGTGGAEYGFIGGILKKIILMA